MHKSKIGDIALFLRTGKTPPSKEKKYFNGKINWYTPGDLDNTKKLGRSSRTISEIAIIDKKAILYPKNTLLITCIGDVGRLGITTNECSSNQQITGIVPIDKVDVDFLYYWFVRNQRVLSDLANSAVVPMVNNKTLKNLNISYPLISTQKKLAAILDEADKLRQLDKSLIAKYDQLAQSLFLEMFGDPVNNPRKWEKQNLNKITSKIGSGATPKGGKESYKNEGISLIRSLNIHDNFFKEKDLAFIDGTQAAKLNNVVVEKDDVLFNITGASVARCALVPDYILPARVNQHVSILRPKKNILSPQFLMYLLISPNSKIQLLGVGANNAATRESITKEQLTKFEVILPPIELQNKFAIQVKAIESQKAQAQKALAKSEELFNSLLQKAFRGELV